MSELTLAPIFSVRLAGAPFELLERFGTPAVSERARRVNALGDAVQAAAKRAQGDLHALADPKLRKKIWEKLSRRTPISPEHAALHPSLADYATAVDAHTAELGAFDAIIDGAYVAALAALAREAGRALPDFVVLESAHLLAVLRELEELAGARHASPDRKRHRTLALYMQRVCAKNDTFSRFGPVMWGHVEAGDGVVQHLRPKLARRVEVETWVVARLIDLVNTDADVRAELAPRLHAHGRLEDGMFVRLDEQREIPLSASEYELARTCDGVRTARSLGHADVLADLADRGVIVWRLDRYARDSSPFSSLLAEIRRWENAAARERWHARLVPIQALVERFAADPDVDVRAAVLQELAALLDALGVTTRTRTRTLYAATNPINENCTLESTLALGRGACDRLVEQAWPWFAFWSDATAYAVDRVYRRLFEIVAVAPRRAGKLQFSSLLHAARAQDFDLDYDGAITDVAREAWKDIQHQFAARLADRPDAPAWRLTADDCTFLRSAHALLPPGELALPSLDLLPCARSADDAAAGRFDWVIGETHLATASLQHAIYWHCPDKRALFEVMLAASGHAPFLSRDGGNDLPVHVCREAFVAHGMPYVGSAPVRPEWNVIRPADAEVVVDEAARDIRLRSPSGDDLGSLVQTAAVTMGMHPFFPLVRVPHEPRLYLGDVVVQRRAWYIDFAKDIGSSSTATFVLAIERLRAERGIPRWVYMRPQPGSLGGSAEHRDKDNKPICIDLEGLVYLDVLEGRFRKYKTLVFVEMLPTPEQLFLEHADGRVLFEIRTNVIPREARR